MLTVIGDLQSEEYEAAKVIKTALEKLWPRISTCPSREANVVIVSGCKVYGQDTTDIDVVLCISFAQPERFRPTSALTTKEGSVPDGLAVEVTSLIVAIEVKSHPANFVHYSGGQIFVDYKSGKSHNATLQNEKQMYALQKYLQNNAKLEYAQIHRCVMMLGLDEVSITGGLPAKFNGRAFLTELCKVFPVSKWQGLYRMRGPSRQEMEKVFASDIFREFTPSNGDRRRIELITSKAAAQIPVSSFLGSKFLRLRGRGGSGKTIMLLKAAWEVSKDRGLSSIILTYNQALATDIKRLLALLRVPSEIDGGIRVETVMSFFLQWVSALGILPEDLELFESGEYQEEKYQDQLLIFNKMFEEGALTVGDISAIKDKSPEKFAFDCILVDEAHDWPEGEIVALKTLYDPTRIALADGIDQFVRGGYARAWLKGIAQHDLALIDLDLCLRLKSNLARFANRIAESVGLTDWVLKPNSNMGGGTIRLIENESLEDLESGIVSIVNKAKNDGNAEIDCLLCVPPDRPVSGITHRSKQLIDSLKGLGFQVWDATDPQSRKSPPRDEKSLRVVKYASCRGLEGWSVVLLGVDDQWESYYEHHLDRIQQQPGMGDPVRAAELCAWESLLIAFTRPIDNITMTISDPLSKCGKVFFDLKEKYPDSIRVGFD
ncbi:MAG: hypothetical protein P8N92_09130 [Burkholderiales bacterium]|nr:hypothetical protein [Burkholderiales bacterium]